MQSAPATPLVPAVKFMKVEGVDAPELPAYQSYGAAGFDLRACINNHTQETTIGVGQRVLIGTGWKVEIPQGFEGQVRPRSGLALKNGLTVLNSPGTIDCDYRGQIMVLLINHGEEAVTIRHQDRIAQMVISPVLQASIQQVENLSDSGRGEGGYGSTKVA